MAFDSCTSHPKIIDGINVPAVFLREIEGYELVGEGPLETKFGKWEKDPSTGITKLISGKCFCFDICHQFWSRKDDPVHDLKKDGCYPFFKEQIEASRISGTFYRGTSYYEAGDLEIGDTIDYSGRLSSWSIDIGVAHDFCTVFSRSPANAAIFILTCSEAPGFYCKDDANILCDINGRIRGGEEEHILGECRLIIVGQSKYKGIPSYNVKIK